MTALLVLASAEALLARFGRPDIHRAPQACLIPLLPVAEGVTAGRAGAGVRI